MSSWDAEDVFLVVYQSAEKARLGREADVSVAKLKEISM
jgi:hypothetical protein